MTVSRFKSWVRGVSGFLVRKADWANHTLIEPRLAKEDDRRREQVLNIILVGSIGLLAFTEGVVLNGTIHKGIGAQTVAPLGAFSLLLGFFVGLYVLSRKGLVRTASYLLVVAYFIANGYAALRWGITIPTVLVGYALLIVIAGMVVDSRFGFITAGAIALSVIPMWLFQLDGLVAVDPDEMVTGDGLALVILYFLIMTVAWLSNRQIEGSLARAHRSEKALMEQRDRLEIEVEERTRELREAQFAKVEQLYHFAEFGQMASGLFHDLVNFFNAVLLHMQQPDDESIAGMAQAQDRLETAGMLTKRVNEFVEAIRKQLADNRASENFSIVAEIKQVIQLLAYTARKRNVRISLDGEEATCFGNCFKFHQVIMNLVLNAIEAYDGPTDDMSRERSVVVRVEKKEAHVMISVADHGSGISEDMREKIFKPFFTTKQNGKGMGIGLAITKKIIENDFKGMLELESEVGIGSTFTVRIKSV